MKRREEQMKEKPIFSAEEMDRLHHQLAEQIAKVIVNEEEERMKAEMELNKQLNDVYN